jgi:hypothetical protein
VTTRASFRIGSSVVACAAALLAVGELQAQFLGLNLRGDVGLRSGTQPPPGVYFALPMYYGNANGRVQDPHGNTVQSTVDPNLSLFVTPTFGLTTKSTIFNATYAFQLMVPLMSTRLAIAPTDVSTLEDYGLGDLYVQPASLGWHSEYADFRAGYAFFAPTGWGERSLDMWAHELSAGSTVYFDGQQRWHLAATAFYEIHQKKVNQDVRVGAILTIEGGFGGPFGLGMPFFLKGAGTIGVAYVAQWKITRDSGDDFPAEVPKGQSRAFGIGPELAMPLFAAGNLAGLFNARYVWEFGGRSSLESQTFVASFTLAKLNLP